MADVTSTDTHGKHHDFIAKIICLLLALVLWIYVMEVENPDWEETIEGVPVNLINTDEIEIDHNLTIYGGYSNTVDITLRGRRNQISGITADDITATADVSEIEKAGEYTLPISVSLPRDAKIVESSVETVTVLVDKREQTTVDVVPRYSGLIIEDGYILGDPILSVSTVTVTGPSRYLSAIDHAEVALPDLGRVTSSLQAYGDVTLIDSDGGVVSNPFVTVSNSVVNVQIPVYAFKAVPLKVDFLYGFFNDDNTTITLDHDMINVRGDAEVISGLDSIVVATIDEKLYSKEDTSIKVKLALPDGVENTDGIDEVSISIKHLGTETRSIVLPIGEENVINPNGVQFTLQVSSLLLTLRGDPGELYQVSAANVTPEIDLSVYTTDQSGRFSIPVTLKFTATETVYEIGQYSVDVILNGETAE